MDVLCIKMVPLYLIHLLSKFNKHYYNYIISFYYIYMKTKYNKLYIFFIIILLLILFIKYRYYLAMLIRENFKIVNSNQNMAGERKCPTGCGPPNKLAVSNGTIPCQPYNLIKPDIYNLWQTQKWYVKNHTAVPNVSIYNVYQKPLLSPGGLLMENKSRAGWYAYKFGQTLKEKIIPGNKYRLSFSLTLLDHVSGNNPNINNLYVRVYSYNLKRKNPKYPNFFKPFNVDLNKNQTIEVSKVFTAKNANNNINFNFSSPLFTNNRYKIMVNNMELVKTSPKETKHTCKAMCHKGACKYNLDCYQCNDYDVVYDFNDKPSTNKSWIFKWNDADSNPHVLPYVKSK